MNTDKILQLADYIEERADFDLFNHERCFSGHARELFQAWLGYTDVLRVHLELSELQASDLYWIWPCADGTLNDALIIEKRRDHHHAAKVLRHLAETGRVDFEV